MKPSTSPRWHQFSLASLLIAMTLAGLLARPTWHEFKRWQARGYDWEYWRLSGRQVTPEERQRAAVERGLKWLQTNTDHADWQAESAAGQTQESDL